MPSLSIWLSALFYLNSLPYFSKGVKSGFLPWKKYILHLNFKTLNSLISSYFYGFSNLLCWIFHFVSDCLKLWSSRIQCLAFFSHLSPYSLSKISFSHLLLFCVYHLYANDIHIYLSDMSSSFNTSKTDSLILCPLKPVFLISLSGINIHSISCDKNLDSFLFLLPCVQCNNSLTTLL